MFSVGTLPAGWEDLALGDVVKTSSGGTPTSKHPAFYGGDIPWVKIGDLNDALVKTTEQTITEEGLDNSSAKRLPAGALLVAMYGSIGKLGVLSMPATTNQAICAMQPAERLRLRYLYWFLRSQREQLLAMGRGGTQLNIGQGDLKALRIPVPPLGEQDAIVETVECLLATVRDGTTAFERALVGLSQFRTACLADAFDDECRQLDELATIQSGIAKGRPSGDELLEVPYIRTANVQALHLDLAEVKTLAVTPQQREKHLLQVDDVLVLEGGDADKVGRGWIWSGEVSGCLHQNHVFAVRPCPDVLVPRYLAYYINAPQARRYFLSVAKQTVNLASINKSNLKGLPVPVPSIGEQQRVVAQLDSQLSAAATVAAGFEERLRDVESMRRALLHSAFGGELTRKERSASPPREVGDAPPGEKSLVRFS